MTLKVAKCRSLAYRRFYARQTCEFVPRQDKSYSCYDPLITIEGIVIPFVGDDNTPIFKYLGFKIQFDFRDDLIRRQIDEQLREWLQKVDDCFLTGPQKSWIANHLVCSKLAWSLMIHAFCTSQAGDWAKLVHRFYRKWMGLAHSAEPLILYRSNTHFGLAFKHVGDLHKHLQVVKWHIMKHSRDPTARAVYRRRVALDQQGHVGTGRKFAPSLEVERLESLVHLERITGHGQSGRTGLGYLKKKPVPTTPKESRKRMSEIMKLEAEEKRTAICMEYEMQCSWLNYGLTEFMEKDLTWNKLLYMYSEALVKFCLNVRTNTLPSPDNIRRWGKATNLCCGLYGLRCATLNHILAGCPWVRNRENNRSREDRYTWRHNCVLLEIAKHIADFFSSVNSSPTLLQAKGRKKFFVKAGAPTQRKKPKTPSGVLQSARDWVFDFDLPD